MAQRKQLQYILVGLGVVTLSASAVPSNFERYQVILDKQPFGSVVVPVEPVNVQPVVAPGPAWTKNFRLTMLQEEMDGTLLVGLVNNQTKESIMLLEGESHPDSGIKFISGDYETGRVTVSKGGDIRTLGTDENQVVTAPAPAPKATQAGAKPRSVTTSASSYAERRSARQRRLADLRKQREEAASKPPAMPPAALQQHLEQMQVEAIKKGAPPLPVPITPAMEAQIMESAAPAAQ